MDNGFPLHLWLMRALYFGLCFLVILVHLLPLEITVSRVPAPDFMACLTLAWVLRRPEFVPLVLIAAVFLLADFFFLRPPGLYAALAVLGAEILRSRGEAFYEMPFSFEWVLVAVILTGMAVGNQVLHAVTLLEAPSLGLSLIQLILTIVAYPLVVVLSRSIFGVRRRHPGEIDVLGRRA